MDNRVLISTNGFEGTWPAIEYGGWVAEVTGFRILLLGVSETAAPRAQDHAPALVAMLERAAALYGSRGLQFSVERHVGNSEEVIPRVSRQVNGLTVLGPLGRPVLKRLLMGRSIRGLLETISTPVLYVRNSCLPMRKVLICLGGLGYEITAEHLALRLGAAAGAEAVLLHVAPPVDMDYPTARVEREHWRELVTTDSLLGRNLRSGLEAARAAGMPATIKARQGDVVEEILLEAKSGAYDLICLGSHHGSTALRHLYEPNVTDEVAEHASCPVLTARFAVQPSARTA